MEPCLKTLGCLFGELDEDRESQRRPVVLLFAVGLEYLNGLLLFGQHGP